VVLVLLMVVAFFWLACRRTNPCCSAAPDKEPLLGCQVLLLHCNIFELGALVSSLKAELSVQTRGFAKWKSTTGGPI
jgi:hypothetical protein